MPQATFGVLRQVLLDLGFIVRSDAKAVRFDHAATGTSLMYRPYADDDEVTPGDLVAARFHLDFKGLLPRERFEDLLRQKVAAG